MPDRKRSDIEIETPCPKSWGRLVGDEKRRFCSECELHVHNSAVLTREEVLDLVQSSDERVCMRIVRDGNGAPQYLDSCVPAADPREAKGPIRALPRAAGWILAAGAGLMSACEDTAPPVDPAPHGGPPVVDVTTMGVVAPALPERMGKAASVEVLGEAVRVELGEVAFPVQQDGQESPGCIPIDEAGDSGCQTEEDSNAENEQTEMLGRIAPLDTPRSEGN
jgi:hypothetical protein